MRGKSMKKITSAVIVIICASLMNCRQKPGGDFPCPGKSFSIGTHKYCAYKGYATWHEAKKRCSDAGGYLAVINSAEESKSIWALLGSTWEHAVWIGLTDRTVEGSWQWISNEPVKYGNWKPGQPDNYQQSIDGEDCTAWYSDDGKWNDVDCSIKLSYLCKSMEGRKKEFRCTGKLFSSGDYEYCAYRAGMDWQGARKSCEVNGGNLASILDDEENSSIFNYLGSSWGYSGHLWIGFSDEAQEGNYKWINGEPVNHGNWCTGEPNNAGKEGEDCAHFSTMLNCWNDLNCSAQLGYLCESD
jgi:hypothetical protein